jgi:4-amino-4-deoxy-L-arabinose transferase-like glycosyltransferase
MNDALSPAHVRRWSFRPEEIAGALLVLVSRLFTLPQTPWELDELLFTRGVIEFDPQDSRPHPPGYPLLIGLGKLVHLFVDDPWSSLVVLSVIATVLGFIFFNRAAATITGDRVTGFAAATLFFFSSSMLVHGTLALSDGTMLMFVALALLAAARYEVARTSAYAMLFAVSISAAIGTRPQMAIALLPVFLVVVARMATWRHRVTTVLGMTVASLLWFIPLVLEAGGWSSFTALQLNQAAYFAQHDAEQSRGARSLVRTAGRFIIYPWEPKLVALPVLLAAAVGASRLLPRWRIALPTALLSAVHIGFALAAMDPADGPRYSLPAMFFVAIAASSGIAFVADRLRWRNVTVVVALLFGAASIVFSSPILLTRAREASPPAQAAAHIRKHMPAETVVLYDLSLRPHAEHLLAGFRTRPTDAGLLEFYDDPDVPLVHLADGGSALIGSKSFSWPESKAYTRLTRKHYRVVSLETVPAASRFKPVRGMWPPERTEAGLTWRWLAPEAELELPSLDARSVRLQFGLTPETPYDASRVEVAVDGQVVTTATVTRLSGVIDVPLRRNSRILTLRSAASWVPGEVIRNGDGRRLSLQLLSLEQRW